MIELVLAAIISLSSHWHPGETDAQYQARLGVIAEAVTLESKAAQGWPWSAASLAFAVIATMYAESRFTLRIHQGRHMGDGGRSRCLGQVQRLKGFLSSAQWRETGGTGMVATRACARAVIKYLIKNANKCTDGITFGYSAMNSIFAGYRRGVNCHTDAESRKRAWQWIQLMEKRKPPRIAPRGF